MPPFNFGSNSWIKAGFMFQLKDQPVIRVSLPLFQMIGSELGMRLEQCQSRCWDLCLRLRGKHPWTRALVSWLHLCVWPNKTPGCLSNENLFLRAPEAEKSKTKKPVMLVSGEDPFSSSKMTAFPPCPYTVERGTRSCYPPATDHQSRAWLLRAHLIFIP